MTHATPATAAAVTFDPAACAALLAHAWRTGTLIDALPAPARPADIAQGYAAQAALLPAAGYTLGGWKLGVGSTAQLRATGLARPLVGHLAAERCLPDGAQVTPAGEEPVIVECEIGLVLARDVVPGEPVADPAALVAHACVTFEIVRPRLRDRAAAGWPSFVADNVSFDTLVTGAALPLAAVPEVRRTLALTVDGRPADAPVLAGDDAVEPLAMLTVLVAHAGEEGITLRRGHIVSTGTLTRPLTLAGRGHAVRATFAGGALGFRL